MACPKLDAIPSVDIDNEGTFKYVLIKAYSDDKDGSEQHKLLVRGYKRAEWHSDIYDETSKRISPLGVDTECLGGGRIEHRPQDKHIKVYGYSQGYGKADHAVSVGLLKQHFPDYEITWTDDGY